jgi:drug/metabolite transporter (DMT)-like permease
VKRAQLSSTAAALLVALVIVCWGVNWPVGKILLRDVPPLWIVALRSAVGTVTLLAICLARRRLVLPRLGDIPVVLSVGLLHMTAFSVLVSLGMQHVSAGRSVVLAYTTPLWVVPGAWLFLDEKFTAVRLFGVALGLTGLLLIFSPQAFDWSDRQTVLGNGLVMLAALCWAGSILYVRAHTWLTPPFELTFWQALLATCVLTPLALLFEGAPSFAWTPRVLLLLLYGGVFGIAVAYWAFTTVNRALPATATSLGLLGVPVFGIVCAALALSETMSAVLLAAMALILGGIVVGTIRRGHVPGP